MNIFSKLYMRLKLWWHLRGTVEEKLVRLKALLEDMRDEIDRRATQDTQRRPFCVCDLFPEFNLYIEYVREVVDEEALDNLEIAKLKHTQCYWGELDWLRLKVGQLLALVGVQPKINEMRRLKEVNKTLEDAHKEHLNRIEQRLKKVEVAIEEIRNYLGGDYKIEP